LSFTARSDASGQYSDSALFEARLVSEDGQPLACRVVTFELRDSPEGSAPGIVDMRRQEVESYKANTDSDGLATLRTTLTGAPDSYTLFAHFDGDDGHEASSDTADFRILKEDVRMRVRRSKRAITARLSDLDDDRSRVAGASVRFVLAGKSLGSRKTNGKGIARISIPQKLRDRHGTVRAVFKGDAYYRRTAQRIRA
jgi:hypothetical protein